MARPWGLGLCLLLLVTAGAVPARAGGPDNPASATTLETLSRHAGFIFRGRVLRVDRPKAARGTVATVYVTFEVLEGIRGVRTGERLTVQEWAGLWAAGRERYRPGQELLLFLYPRSRLGLTSPVGGELGVFPIDAQGAVVSPLPPAPAPGRKAVPPQPNPRVPYREFSGRVRKAAGE